MPCYDPRVECSSNEVAELRAKVDTLTDLLCKAGRARHNKTNIPPEVLKWWEDHCEIDRKRGEPW